jgi:hypothetical protein
MSRRSFHRRAGVGGLAQNGHGLALRDGLAVQASAGTIADPAVRLLIWTAAAAVLLAGFVPLLVLTLVLKKVVLRERVP